MLFRSGVVDIRGGMAGKASWLPVYTEKQKYGIELDVSYNGILTVQGVELRNNNTGALYDNNGTGQGSFVSACPGYTPRGTTLQSVGASPYTYTAGLTVEYVNLYNGTGVVSTINGVAVASTSPCSFALQPRQSVTVSYITTPTMVINKG